MLPKGEGMWITEGQEAKTLSLPGDRAQKSISMPLNTLLKLKKMKTNLETLQKGEGM